MQIVLATVFCTRRAPSLHLTCLHVMNVDKCFYVCAQPMPHDMAYPLLSCLRTIACHVDRDVSGARISQQLAEVCMQRWMNDEYEPVLEQMGSLVGAKRRIKRGRPKDWNSTKLGWQELLDNAEGGAGLPHNIT